MDQQNPRARQTSEIAKAILAQLLPGGGAPPGSAQIKAVEAIVEDIIQAAASEADARLSRTVRDFVDPVSMVEEFGPATIRKAKAAIKRALRRGLKDKDGNRIEVASIVMTDDDGKKRRVYKAELLLDVGDFIQVVAYWQDCKRTAEERVRHYIDLAIRLHGPQIRGLLPLGDDDEPKGGE